MSNQRLQRDERKKKKLDVASKIVKWPRDGQGFIRRSSRRKKFFFIRFSFLFLFTLCNYSHFFILYFTKISLKISLGLTLHRLAGALSVRPRPGHSRSTRKATVPSTVMAAEPPLKRSFRRVDSRSILPRKVFKSGAHLRQRLLLLLYSS